MSNNVISLDARRFDNKLLVTHTDLDGVGCALVFLRCYPKARVIFADYDNVNEFIMEILKHDKNEDILITDLSVNAEVAELLDRRGKVGMLDHHDTAKWLAEKYEWATVDNRKCGTRLTFEMLKQYFHLDDLEEIVDLIEDWDLWGAASGSDRPRDSAIELQMIFEFYGRNRFLYNLIEGRKFDPEIPSILMEHFKAYCEETVEIMEIHEKDGYVFGVCMADRYKSLLGHWLLSQFDIEYVMILDPRKGVVSLRGKGNIHLGELAKKAGGGGHPKAAGFPLGGIKSIMNMG